MPREHETFTHPTIARLAHLARIVACTLLLATHAVAQRPAQWIVGSTPAVTIGASETDTTDILNAVVGATRLPDGRILVGDRGPYALRLFTADGKAIRSFGRKGGGPGEIGYLKALLRCGDSLVTMDIDGRRTSVFSIDGTYVRVFHFGGVQSPGSDVGRQPYTTACGPGMIFAHYGWEQLTEVRMGAYRPIVPFWLSRADNTILRPLGTFPGAERMGVGANGRLGGSRPLPLGRQTYLAVSADRIYIGTGDRYEILVFDRTGNPLPSIHAERPVVATSSADIERFKAIETAGMGGIRRARAEVQFADFPFPKTLPAYGALLVDTAGNLWVQDYPRPTSATVGWSIFDPQGTLVAETRMSSNFEVYEIGDDYVLGRWYDPDDAIPQVRLYALRRSGER